MQWAHCVAHLYTACAHRASVDESGGNAESLQCAGVSEHEAVAAARAVAGPALLRNMKVSRQSQPPFDFVQWPTQLLPGIHVEHVGVASERVADDAC